MESRDTHQSKILPDVNAASVHPDLRTRISSLFGRVLSRYLGLPSPTHREVVRQRDVPIAMTDGVVLRADIWYPQTQSRAPVILIRSPYGRGGLQGLLFGTLFAQQGFRVICQSCRGTADSGGEFVPFRNEAADAQDTVKWMRNQPWFTGKFATYGSSYVGYTQWALAVDPPPELAAMVVSIAVINPYTFVHRCGAFSYEVMLTWVRAMPNPPARLLLLLDGRRRARAIWKAAEALPLKDGYIAANKGRRSQFFEACLEHSEPGDPWWTSVDYSAALQNVKIPVLLQSGWHDFYAAETLAQYQTLRGRGVETALTMAATTHAGFVRALATTFPDEIAWLRSAFVSERPKRAGAIMAQVEGHGQWRTYEEWPPARTKPYSLYLQPAGKLSAEKPPSCAPDRYRYDPTDPTPSIGGELFALHANQDNRPMEVRRDVLHYTTESLSADLEIVGEVKFELWFSSSLAHTDIFARLCDVAIDGRSTAVCDTLLRLTPGQVRVEPNGIQLIQMVLSPTLHHFKKGHRLSLLVCSGAHPRFVRNTGSCEQLASACRLVAADQAVFHDTDHPSCITMQVLAVADPAHTTLG